MKRILTVSFVVVCLCFGALSAAQTDNWVQFRGPGGTSVAESTPPVYFDNERNIAWQIDLPGKGASGPIVVDNQVIVTSSAGANQDQLFVQAFNLHTGKSNWIQKFTATGRCFCDELSANAAPTPVSDGKKIYALYSSNDLACLDVQGNLVWYRGLAFENPLIGNDFGMASSPVVHDGVVVVQLECPGDSFVIALDANTGTTLWKIPRNKNGLWATPLMITPTDAEPMVLLQSKTGIEVFDLKTGQSRFRKDGECSTISSSAIAGNRLYVPLDGTTAFAVSDQGEFEEIWNSSSLRPSSASGIVYQDKIFATNSTGVLTAFRSNDGTPGEKARVCDPRSLWSTPVVACGHMYFFTQFGKAHVVRLSDQLEVVHEYDFGSDECFLGSPAVSQDALFVRSHKRLYKLADSRTN